MGTRIGTAPCTNPDCDNRTYVRLYGASYTEPGFESTDLCDECQEPLDFSEFEDDDGYDDPRL